MCVKVGQSDLKINCVWLKAFINTGSLLGVTNTCEGEFPLFKQLLGSQQL